MTQNREFRQDLLLDFPASRDLALPLERDLVLAKILNILEDVEAMKGVRDVVWTEVIETIGQKNPPNHIEF